MFENLFNRCPHEYKQVGNIPARATHDGTTYDVPCFFLECKHCGKRKVLREPDFNYLDSFLAMLDLWERGQYKINFKDYLGKENECSCVCHEPNNNTYYEIILRKILDELERFNLEMSDSENRLVTNNIKAIVQDALAED